MIYKIIIIFKTLKPIQNSVKEAVLEHLFFYYEVIQKMNQHIYFGLILAAHAKQELNEKVMRLILCPYFLKPAEYIIFFAKKLYPKIDEPCSVAVFLRLVPLDDYGNGQ